MSKNSRLKASSDSRTASGYRSPPSPKGKVYEVFRSEYYLPLWEGFNPICLPQRGRWIEEKWQALRRETDEESPYLQISDTVTEKNKVTFQANPPHEIRLYKSSALSPHPSASPPPSPLGKAKGATFSYREITFGVVHLVSLPRWGMVLT